MTVQLRATAERSGVVVWVDESEADQFSVYESSEDGTFVWVADFANYDDAFSWATYRAEAIPTELENHVRKG
jgi:hypothetical protein